MWGRPGEKTTPNPQQDQSQQPPAQEQHSNQQVSPSLETQTHPTHPQTHPTHPQMPSPLHKNHPTNSTIPLPSTLPFFPLPPPQTRTQSEDRLQRSSAKYTENRCVSPWMLEECSEMAELPLNSAPAP